LDTILRSWSPIEISCGQLTRAGSGVCSAGRILALLRYQAEEKRMHAGMSEFIAEQMKGLTEMVTELRRSRVEAARKAAVESAARIKSLNQRVRSLARSGLRVTAASQGAVQSLIELQEDIVTSALNDAAVQMERLAYTESVRDLARVQGEILQAARQRIVDDIARAVTVLKSAAGDMRKAAERPEAAKPIKTKAKAKAKVKVKAKTRTPTRAARNVRKTARRARR
jgi:hypothetical protein